MKPIILYFWNKNTVDLNIKWPKQTNKSIKSPKQASIFLKKSHLSDAQGKVSEINTKFSKYWTQKFCYSSFFVPQEISDGFTSDRCLEIQHTKFIFPHLLSIIDFTQKRKNT